MKCLDTTFLVDLVQDPRRIQDIVTRLGESSEVLSTTAINLYEALVGAYTVKDRRKGAKIEDKIEKAVARMEVLPLREDDAREGARIAGRLRRQGIQVGVDVLVASIAIGHGCEGVVTRNVDHFKAIERLTGLEVLPY